MGWKSATVFEVKLGLGMKHLLALVLQLAMDVLGVWTGSKGAQILGAKRVFTLVDNGQHVALGTGQKRFDVFAETAPMTGERSVRRFTLELFEIGPEIAEKGLALKHLSACILLVHGQI